MMRTFTYNGLPTRVIFGHGTLSQLPAEVERLGLNAVLVLATPQQADQAELLSARLGACSAGVYAKATMHTPFDITEDAMGVVGERRVDGLVAVGGGSTTGLAKAIALRSDLPQIVAPTTYAGSEMTPILGETRDGIKTTVRDARVLPETVIYDVDLTLTLPAGMSGTSGINAIAHAVEALYAQDTNPVIKLMAIEGISAMARALPFICRQPDHREARSDALYGAWLCGMCLGSVGMALHHKLCHVLGGTFDLPHAETHTSVLPHAMAYNSRAAAPAMAAVASAIGVKDAAIGLYDLAESIGARMALKEFGMPMQGIEQAADIAMRNPYWNPEPLERNAIRDLIARAYAGERPTIADGRLLS